MLKHSFDEIDRQMQSWSSRLRDDLGIDTAASQRLGTAIAKEVASLPEHIRKQVANSIHVRISDRLDELTAFQAFMDILRNSPIKLHPAVVRAQVITQNYICFVYLGDSCFKTLRKEMPSGPTRRCCVFLTDNPVRAFRNAVAHANWKYLSDYSGIEFWARKGSDPDEALTRFEVKQQELGFWQALARTTAYAALLACVSA